MRIDLHAHTTASDGSDSPAELMVAARAANLDTIAITDHDTTRGWHEAFSALPDGLTLVPGIELSCASYAERNPIKVHILGYLFDPAFPPLIETYKRIFKERRRAAKRSVELLAADGYPISWDQVRVRAEGSVGRPHIAEALVQAGVVESVPAAFRTLLHANSPYYVARHDIDALDGIRMLRDAGGVAAMAHPRASRGDRLVDDDVIATMAHAGLNGIEIDHPDHAPADRTHLERLATELDLLALGSSDYHGTNKVVSLGSCTTKPEVYEALVSLATFSEPVRG